MLLILQTYPNIYKKIDFDKEEHASNKCKCNKKLEQIQNDDTDTEKIFNEYSDIKKYIYLDNELWDKNIKNLKLQLLRNQKKT